jgi:hypothetical protein
MASMVAPFGDFSIAITRDCFEGCAGLALDGLFVSGRMESFATAEAFDAGGRFFADFDIDILRWIETAWRRTTEAPPRNKAGGAVSRNAPLMALGTDPTTALFAA